MPTPAAVLAAGTLLSEGSATQKGLGKLMMVDVGGATTDVYSFNENKPYPGARLMGCLLYTSSAALSCSGPCCRV